MSGSLPSDYGDITVANPLDVYAKTLLARKSGIEVQNALAGQAANQILQQATDKNTGVTDYLLAGKLAALAGPQVGIVMGGLLKDASALRGSQLEQASYHNNLAARTTADLMRSATNADLARVRQKLIDNGLPQSMVDADIAEYQGLNEAGRKALAYSHLNSTLDANEAMARGGFPKPAATDVGPAIVPTATTPAAPGRPANMVVGGGGVTLGLSPAQLAQPVTVTDSKGNPINTTVGELLRSGGIPTQQGGAQVGAAQPGAPGGQPAAPAGTGASTSQPGATTAPSGPRGVFGPAAGAQEEWKASTEAYNAANEAAGNYQERIFPLIQAYSILKSGNVTTGQKADVWNNARGAIQTLAAELGMPVQSIQQADAETLNKYLQQYVNRQPMAGRSDQQLASAISGNPSSHISNLANEQVIPVMIGMERMRQLMLSDFKKTGQPSTAFNNFRTNWQNTHDPRAFIVDMLGDKIVPIVKGMNKDDRARFDATLKIVEANPGVMAQPAIPH